MQEEKAVLLRPTSHLLHVLSLGLVGRCGLGPQEGREWCTVCRSWRWSWPPGSGGARTARARVPSNMEGRRWKQDHSLRDG